MITDKFKNIFAKSAKKMIKDYSDTMEMLSRMCVNVKIKQSDINEIRDYANNKYSQTPNALPWNAILNQMYVYLVQGYEIEDSKLLTKAWIIKDIMEKYLERKLGLRI